MKLTIQRLNIDDIESNEIKSHKVFRARKVFDDDGNPIFHPDGIFSDTIFGKIGKCKCGNLTSPGVCPICNTRVLNKNRLPDFYIKFPNLDIPFKSIDVSAYPKIKKELKNLFNYKGFIYRKKYYDYDLENLDLTKFNTKDVKIGKDAILSLGVDEDWYNKQVTDKLFVPHTSIRKITVQEDNYFLGELNVLLINILKKKNKLTTFENLNSGDIFTELSIKHELLEDIQDMYTALYEMISVRKKSIINREIRGQGITGAARAVITNNFDLDEDTALIGYYFIPILFPHIYDKHLDEDGCIDIDAVNSDLKDYMILINRQPTIGEKSMMAFHPVFSKEDSEKYVLQLNPLTMDGYAGDFDGDVLLMMALYSVEACNEAKRLLPSRNFLGGADGNIRNKIFDDLEYVMQKLYEDGNADKIHNLIKDSQE